jgi:hypothetical protein
LVESAFNALERRLRLRLATFICRAVEIGYSTV